MTRTRTILYRFGASLAAVLVANWTAVGIVWLFYLAVRATRPQVIEATDLMGVLAAVAVFALLVAALLGFLTFRFITRRLIPAAPRPA